MPGPQMTLERLCRRDDLTRRTEELLAIVILAVTVFLAHFTHFSEFGFYEDDYWAIANSMTFGWADLWLQAKDYFRTWPTGRPLNHLLPRVLAVLGVKFGGVSAMYALGAGWLLFNAWLVYRIAKGLFPISAALLAGVSYVLFPPDTTRPLLIHVSHVQGAMTFSLLGLLLWRRGGVLRVVSYPVAALALLSYETAFIPFLFAPLLVARTARSIRWPSLLVHLSWNLLAAGVVAMVRILTQESRASEALSNLERTAFRSVTSLYLGPLTDIRATFRALWGGARHIDLWAAASITLFAAMFLVWQMNRAVIRGAAGAENRVRKACLSERCRYVGILLLWPASYALTLTNYPPTQLAGRLTSTHMAAALPCALLVGSLYSYFSSRSRAWRIWSRTMLSWGFILSLSYDQFVQREYARMWKAQVDFWQQVFELCPDVDADVSILVTGGVRPDRSEVIEANSWDDYHACRWMFGYPLSSAGPHFAHLGVLSQSVPFRRGKDGTEWMPEFWGGPYRRLDSNLLILLRSENGRLLRVSSIETSMGTLVATRSIPPPSVPSNFNAILSSRLAGQ